MSKPPATPQITPAQQEQLLAQLATHLDAELAVQRRLAPIAEARTAAIIANDHARLAELAASELPAADEAARLRGVREKLQRALAHAFSLTKPTVSAVAAKAAPEVASRLATTTRELAALAQRAQKAHERNGLLARQALGFVRDLLAVMTGSTPGIGPAYDRKGLAAAYGPSTRGGLVDCAG